MSNLTTVGITSGIPTSGTGTVSTIDALLAALTSTGQAQMSASLPSAIASNQSTVSVAQDTSQILNGASNLPLTPLFAPIVASSSGVTTLVAAVTSKKIRVLQWIVVVNGAVNFKFQSHVTPTDLTGLFYAGGQGGGAGGVFNPIGHFQTVSGEALDINLSGAVAVGGYLVYVTI